MPQQRQDRDYLPRSYPELKNQRQKYPADYHEVEAIEPDLTVSQSVAATPVVEIAAMAAVTVAFESGNSARAADEKTWPDDESDRQVTPAGIPLLTVEWVAMAD